MMKYIKGAIVAAVLFFWLAPLGIMISDGFWWLLTNKQWSSLVYDGARIYLTSVWSLLTTLPCLYFAGAVLND